MPKQDIQPKVSGMMGHDTSFNGDLKFTESFRIDGKFNGKIVSGETLIIGETGEIDAEIDVSFIYINGNVKGKLNAKERIEIFSKGRVTGSICAPKLIIEEGAFFQGSCQMNLKALEKETAAENIQPRS